MRSWSIGFWMLVFTAQAWAQNADLAELQKRFSPVIVQNCKGRADYFTRFDYDGNWNGNDNWENLEKVVRLPATVYTSAIETSTHVYLGYFVFHPRDWLPINLPLVNHENDLEGVLVVVSKADTKVVLMETFAHYYLYRYAVDQARAGGKTNGTIRFEGEHPIVDVEAYKHGIYAWTQPNLNKAPGVVYRYKGRAEEPRSFTDKDAGYDFVSIESTFWARRHETGAAKLYGKTIATPLGTFGGHFNGTSYANYRAAAPWTWLDPSDSGLVRGDWFFDPALAMQKHFPGAAAAHTRDYVVNPFASGSQMAQRDRVRAEKFSQLMAKVD